MSEEVSARIALLDAQLLDADDLPFGRVDDIELSLDRERPRVVGLLTGTEALGARLGGHLGRALASASARMRPPAAGGGPARIDPALVEEVKPMVKLRASLAELKAVAPGERWLSRKLIGKLPGAGDATQ